MSIIVNLLLLIDGLLYSTIDWLFDIFMFLTKANLFSNDMYADIVRRIYIVLGLVMMFALAYSLLKAVINPDEFSKGENSFPKLVKNVIVSLAIIAILPTVFTVAFNIQNSILNQDTIPKLVLGEEYDSSKYSDAGRTIAYNSFAAFLHVNDEWCKQENKITDPTINLSEDELISCEEKINTNASNVKWYTPWRAFNTNANFKDISQQIEDGNLAFANFNQFGEAVVEGKLSYLMLLSTIFGLFLLCVIANFCFDMAVRVIKLMFFQIIAPIPVVCRVIPGGKMKDVFSTWTKKTISTFMDVFIRIFIMYLGIFIIITIVSEWDGITADTLTSTQLLVAKALVIMGVVVFIRQAPKLIGEMFHLDTGDMKLGLGEKLAMGGGLIAASAAGATGLGTIRNFAKSRRDGKSIGSSLGSALVGGLASGASAGYSARKAKSFGDAKNAASKGMENQMSTRKKIENYIAKRKNEPGGVAGALFDDFTGWLTGKGVEDLDKIIEASGDINKANDAFRNAAKKQWDKHSTDGAIVYNSDENFFKGAGNERMFELYNSYRDERGDMRSASFIKNSIEQRRAEMRNRDLNYYINQQRASLGNAPDKANFYSNLTDANGNRIFNEKAYNDAVADYNTKLANIQQTAQAAFDNDLADLDYLDSMYNQLEKKSITELGLAALEGRDYGTITVADLFDTREAGETAQRIIRDSGLEKYDPSKNKAVEVENGDYATFIDDMAAAATKQASHAAREKQNYLEKKKKS